MIGARVLALFKRGSSGYDHEDLPSSTPGVCQAGAFHSTDASVLAWSRNRLARWQNLEEKERERLEAEIRGDDDARCQELAAAKFWKLLTSRIDDVDPFGQRLLFHLPRSPMTAYRWGAIGAPSTLDALRDALHDKELLLRAHGHSHALDFLYGYLFEYEKMVASLGPGPRENDDHLRLLSRLLLDLRRDGGDDRDRIEILDEMAVLLGGLLETADTGGDEAGEVRAWARDATDAASRVRHNREKPRL